LSEVQYAVRTDVFEGPFDVLLRLITEQRVDLYEVKLSDIVDGFLAELEAIKRLDLDLTTEFLLIAAILVELKSRRLLPDRDSAVNEEDLALLEERDYLLARLVECTTFSAAGHKLAELEAKAARSFPRTAGPDEALSKLAPDLLCGLGPLDLFEAASRALEPRPEPHVNVEHILVDEVTVAEVVERLVGALPSCTPITFRELTSKARSRIEIVIHFLSLLELYKQSLIEIEQGATFGEITVVWTGGEDGASAGAAGTVVSSVVDVEYTG
jgi:segregation and condensation protein A